ncbi:MAG TPA: PGPGW domain-containing protein [Ornithinimicrobium sp.]|nr:PGPGW domain-containing protein [Ornithinimicrobium sp.]
MTAAKRIALETLGWVVLCVGILALFLPGPGLLLTLAGLAILSTQYGWARRLMEPVRVKAWRGAAEGVETVPRIAASVLVAVVMVGVAVLWLWSPPVPGWWPLAERWWLFGGPAVGITMIVSALIALGLLVYAARRFHRHPAAVADVLRMEERYQARRRHRAEARRRLRRMRTAGVPVPTRGRRRGTSPVGDGG